MDDSEFIVENIDNGTVTIDGVVTIDGQVMDIEDSKCHKCNSEVIYYDDFDSYFCAYCNLWLEKRCGDNNCRYCNSRPDKPLPNENQRHRLKYT
jgi:hypothetical protein